MATITPANLSYKDKDGDLGEVKSLTDTDVTLLNNALQDIEDLKLAYSPGFVKRDFSNVTQDGKDAAIGWGQPDYTSGIDIKGSLSTSATSITLASDGYLQINVYNSAANAARRLYIDNSLVITTFGYSGTNTTGYLYPIPKGTYSMSMNDGLTNVTSVMFYPCKGAN